MPKKLLMNNYSENRTMPVMDGLVCWLDGRDYITGGTIWRDRSGHNKNATLTNNSGIKKNNCLYYRGAGNIENPTLNLESYTVEIYLKDLSTGYWNGLYGNTSGSSGTSIYITGRNFGGVNGYPRGLYVPLNSVNSKAILSVVYEKNSVSVYSNGIFIAKWHINIPPSTAKYFVICARKPNVTNDNTDTFADDRLNEWYSFKIYNRALTEKEIQQNYLYEQSIERG